MKKVVCYVLVALIMIGICITYFQNRSYSEYQKEINTLKKDIKQMKTERKTLINEVNLVKEKKSELETVETERIKRLEEWQKLNQEIVNSLS